MTSDRYMKRNCWIPVAAFALATTGAFAATSGEIPFTGPVEGTVKNAAVSLPPDYPPSEAGVRNAAEHGSEALRRYIWRTRMIYNYYFPEFASRSSAH